MRALTVDELRTLIAHEDNPSISIYLATHRGGAGDAEARYQGALRTAREALGKSHKRAIVDELMLPLEALGHQPEFWQEQLEGLCVFRSKNASSYWRLPSRFEDEVVVASSFHVRPLLRYLQSNQRYFLLNLSQGRVSLFKGSAMGLGAIDLAGLPKSLGDVLGVEPRQRSRHIYSGGTRAHSPVFHGAGRDESVQLEEMQRFLRAVDKGLMEVLRDETAPLIVAATERVLAAFQNASRYPHLLHEALHGNFSNAKIEDLHAKAWPIVQKFLREREAELANQYGNLIVSDRATDEISSIARFAVQGRVRDLLLDCDSKLWGKMDRATGAIELHSKRKDESDDDVLDDIAESVLLRGGEVHALPKGKMPTQSPVAAMLRW